MKFNKTIPLILTAITALFAAGPTEVSLTVGEELSNSSAMSRIGRESDAEIWYASLYQGSRNSNGSANLVLDASTTPIALFVTSSENINWNISGFDSCNVVAIVFDSYNASKYGYNVSITATLEDSDGAGITLIRRDRTDEWMMSSITTTPTSNSDFNDVKNYVESGTGLSVTGVTGRYDCSASERIPVPDMGAIDDDAFSATKAEDGSFVFATFPEGYRVQWYRVVQFGYYLDAPDNTLWVGSGDLIGIAGGNVDTLDASKVTDVQEVVCKVSNVETREIVWQSESLWLDEADAVAIVQHSTAKMVKSSPVSVRNDELHVDGSAPFSAKIYSVSGKQLWEINGSTSAVSLKALGLASGLYQISVIQGTKQFNQQIILR